MNISEWTSRPELAEELARLLESPVIKLAIEVVDGMTMAGALNGQGLLQVAQNGQTLFGYDVGHKSALRDLRDLSRAATEHKDIQPDYTGGKTPDLDISQIVRIPKPQPTRQKLSKNKSK